MPEDRFLTMDQAAERLQVSRRTLERQIASGRLVVTRIGRLIRIREEDLEAAFRAGPSGEPAGGPAPGRRPGRGK